MNIEYLCLISKLILNPSMNTEHPNAHLAQSPVRKGLNSDQAPRVTCDLAAFVRVPWVSWAGHDHAHSSSVL